jgi:hypothetical protein
MSVLTKGVTFANNEQITSTRLNNLVDQATFASGAVDGSTMQLINGELAVGVVQTSNIATNAITTTRIADNAIVSAKILNANVTETKIANDAVTNAKIANGEINAPKLNGAQSGSAPIYGVRAWVNFDGTRNATDTGASEVGEDVLIRASGNINRVEKTGTGRYDVFFTIPMQDDDYAVTALTLNSDSGSGNRSIGLRDGEVKSSTVFSLGIRTSAGNSFDRDDISAIVVR